MWVAKKQFKVWKLNVIKWGLRRVGVLRNWPEVENLVRGARLLHCPEPLVHPHCRTRWPRMQGMRGGGRGAEKRALVARKVTNITQGVVLVRVKGCRLTQKRIRRDDVTSERLRHKNRTDAPRKWQIVIAKAKRAGYSWTGIQWVVLCLNWKFFIYQCTPCHH